MEEEDDGEDDAEQEVDVDCCVNAAPRNVALLLNSSAHLVRGIVPPPGAFPRPPGGGARAPRPPAHAPPIGTDYLRRIERADYVYGRR